MNQRETASLAFRIVGLYSLIKAVPYLAGGAAMLRDSPVIVDRHFRQWPDWLDIALMLLPGALLVGLAAGLWFGGDCLARRLFPNGGSEGAPISQISSPDALALSFALVGVIFAALVIPRLFTVIGVSLVSAMQGRPFDTPADFHQLLTLVAQFVLGWVLFFKATVLSRWWHRRR